MPDTALAAFLPELSLAPIAAQRTLDARYRDDFVMAAAAAALLVPVLGSGAASALIPQRLRVSQMRLQTRVRIERDRTRRFRLTVAPVGLGFAALFNAKTASSSQITLTVEQIPLHAHAEEARGGQ